MAATNIAQKRFLMMQATGTGWTCSTQSSLSFSRASARNTPNQLWLLPYKNWCSLQRTPCCQSVCLCDVASHFRVEQSHPSLHPHSLTWMWSCVPNAKGPKPAGQICTQCEEESETATGPKSYDGRHVPSPPLTSAAPVLLPLASATNAV